MSTNETSTDRAARLRATLPTSAQIAAAHRNGTCDCDEMPCTEGHSGAAEGHCPCGDITEAEVWTVTVDGRTVTVDDVLELARRGGRSGDATPAQEKAHATMDRLACDESPLRVWRAEILRSATLREIAGNCPCGDVIEAPAVSA